MRPVDLKMEMCCLKHEIRCALWEKYARAVAGPRGRIRRYLTLFSPAMMDVKHFHRQGLVELVGQTYKGVVAITDDEEAYANAIARGIGRPEHLFLADLNSLLVRPFEYPRYRQAFWRNFPFDVINLDYCDSVFWKGNTHDVSLHIKALEKIIYRQRATDCRQFAVLLTTLAEREELAEHFLSDLAVRIDRNLSANQRFATQYGSLFKVHSGAALRQAAHEEFVPVGLAKFLADLVSHVGFEVLDCEGAYIFRKSGHEVLHIALLARLPRNVPLRAMGVQTQLERNISRYLDHCIDGEFLRLDESRDAPVLKTKHGSYVSDLAARTFELRVPEPEQR